MIPQQNGDTAQQQHEENKYIDFFNPPNVLKLRVQVDVAHSMLRIVSMLVTCLPLDASPESNNHHHNNKQSSFHPLREVQRLKVQVRDRGPTEEDLIVS